MPAIPERFRQPFDTIEVERDERPPHGIYREFGNPLVWSGLIYPVYPTLANKGRGLFSMGAWCMRQSDLVTVSTQYVFDFLPISTPTQQSRIHCVVTSTTPPEGLLVEEGLWLQVTALKDPDRESRCGISSEYFRKETRAVAIPRTDLIPACRCSLFYPGQEIVHDMFGRGRIIHIASFGPTIFGDMFVIDAAGRIVNVSASELRTWGSDVNDNVSDSLVSPQDHLFACDEIELKPGSEPVEPPQHFE